jgi:ABC-2 type transport system permease protein
VLTVSDGAVGGRGVDSGAFYGAAMAVIFSYFTVALATRSVFDERSNGTFARMLVSGARPSSVVAAKTLAVAVISIAGFATVRGVTTLGFGAEWGSASAVLAVIIATVWSIAGVVTLIAGLARTPRQAESLTAAVSFTFALLGGNFVGPVLPEGLEQLSRLTPNGWSLPAFVELNTGSGGVREVAASVAVLCAIGLVAGTLGMWRLNRGVPR